jgi:hypothetical protein
MEPFDFETYTYTANDVVELACEIGWLLERLDPEVSNMMDGSDDSMIFYEAMEEGEADDEMAWMFVNDYEDSINVLDVVRDLNLELQTAGLTISFQNRE